MEEMENLKKIARQRYMMDAVFHARVHLVAQVLEPAQDSSIAQQRSWRSCLEEAALVVAALDNEARLREDSATPTPSSPREALEEWWSRRRA
jgi:hypothetical protein